MDSCAGTHQIEDKRGIENHQISNALFSFTEKKMTSFEKGAKDVSGKT